MDPSLGLDGKALEAYKKAMEIVPGFKEFSKWLKDPVNKAACEEYLKSVAEPITAAIEASRPTFIENEPGCKKAITDLADYARVIVTETRKSALLNADTIASNLYEYITNMIIYGQIRKDSPEQWSEFATEFKPKLERAINKVMNEISDEADDLDVKCDLQLELLKVLPYALRGGLKA